MMGLRLAQVALVATFSLVLCATPRASESTSYKCVDDDGYVTFQDEPCASDESSTEMKIPEDRNVLESEPVAVADEAPAAPVSIGNVTSSYTQDTTIEFKDSDHETDGDDDVIEQAEAPGVRLCAHIKGVYYTTRGRDCKTVAELGGCGVAMQALRDAIVDPQRVDAFIVRLRQSVEKACDGIAAD